MDMELAQQLANLPLAWTLATTCTGSGGFELVADAVRRAMNDALDQYEESKGTLFEATQTNVCQVTSHCRQSFIICYVMSPLEGNRV